MSSPFATPEFGKAILQRWATDKLSAYATDCCAEFAMLGPGSGDSWHVQIYRIEDGGDNVVVLIDAEEPDLDAALAEAIIQLAEKEKSEESPYT